MTVDGELLEVKVTGLLFVTFSAKCSLNASGGSGVLGRVTFLGAALSPSSPPLRKSRVEESWVQSGNSGSESSWIPESGEELSSLLRLAIRDGTGE